MIYRPNKDLKGFFRFSSYNASFQAGFYASEAKLLEVDYIGHAFVNFCLQSVVHEKRKTERIRF